MKTRLAAVLATAGVLTTGTAAALVNTQVLGGQSASGDGATASVPDAEGAENGSATTSSTPLTTPISTPAANTSTLPPVTTAAGAGATTPATTALPTVSVAVSPVSAPVSTATAATAVETAASAPESSASPPPAPSTATYEMGGAGTVTLSVDGDVLRIVEVNAASGWVVERQEHDDAHRVEVRLESGERKVRFEASLLVGILDTSVVVDDD